jgi:hypothetical protein
VRDISLTYQGPLVKNPEPDWLADRSGKHFEALRLFHEACWAWVSFESQRTQPFASVRWGSTIASKADLYDYALDCRRQALLTGFFLLTAEQLDELATLTPVTSNQQIILDHFIALCDRHDETHDRFGQALPAPLFEILRRIEHAPPYHAQGECALTKRIRLGNHAYFAKLTDETLSGHPPVGLDEFNEVSATHALLALCPGIGPEAGFSLLAADGQHCALMAEVPGKSYRDSYAPKAALLVDETWIQRAVLAEWVLGLGDRHAKNCLLDKTTRQIGIIDMAFAWRIHWYFLGWNEEDPPLRFCESYARALFEQRDPTLTFSRDVIQEASEREEQVLHAVQPFSLSPEIIDQLHRQFAILRAVLSQHRDDIPLVFIEHLARSWYNQESTRERGEER